MFSCYLAVYVFGESEGDAKVLGSLTFLLPWVFPHEIAC